MVLSNLGDSDLITSYINGNEKAFETLLLRHKDRVYRYIYSKLKDGQLSNDIFQDTFVKVVNTIKLGNYNEEGKFLPWCMSCLLYTSPSPRDQRGSGMPSSA